MEGIDPREGTLLALVAMRIRAGWARERLLENCDFGHPWTLEVARAMRGDKDVSLTAKAEADRILKWAGHEPQ